MRQLVLHQGRHISSTLQRGMPVTALNAFSATLSVTGSRCQHKHCFKVNQDHNISHRIHGNRPAVQQSVRYLTSTTKNDEKSKKDKNKGQKLYERYLFLKKELKNYRDNLERQKSQEMYNAWQEQQTKQQQSSNSSSNKNLNTKTGVAVVKTLVQQTRLQLKQEQEQAQIQSDYQQQADAALRQAAQSFQYPPACLELAQQYIEQVQQVLEEEAQTVDPHKEKVQQALTLLQKADSPQGWYEHGYLLWTGIPEQTTSDPREALRQAQQKQSSSSAADNHANTNPLLPDQNADAKPLVLLRQPEQAMQSFYKAINQHSPDAMYFVGVQLLSPFMDQLNEQDLDDVMRQRVVADGYRLLEQAATIASHGPALYYLALLHLNGNAVLDIPSIMEQEETLKQQQESSKSNDAKTTIDFTPFTSRLDKAVQAGHAEALYLRGHTQYYGQHGYAVSLGRALEDWVAASKMGHADAAVSAGALYFSMGDPASQAKAFELYQQAGEWGNEEGWRNVISCYLTGKGVPQSIYMAKYIAKTIFNEEISDQVVAAATVEGSGSNPKE